MSPSQNRTHGDLWIKSGNDEENQRSQQFVPTVA